MGPRGEVRWHPLSVSALLAAAKLKSSELSRFGSDGEALLARTPPALSQCWSGLLSRPSSTPEGVAQTRMAAPLFARADAPHPTPRRVRVPPGPWDVQKESASHPISPVSMRERHQPTFQGHASRFRLPATGLIPVVLRCAGMFTINGTGTAGTGTSGSPPGPGTSARRKIEKKGSF